MNPKLVVLLLCALLLPAVQAKAKTILPDACGDDSIKFDVKTEKDQPPPAPPAAGKAQIVFIEDEGPQMATGFGHAEFRYGVDGAWVGANKGNSYFAITVEPGLHHLCVSPQSSNARLKKSLQMAFFTAEAGKVYYFSAQISLTGGGYIKPTYGANGEETSGGLVQGQGFGANFVSLTQLNDDEGKYRVKAWKLATWKADR